MVETPSKNLILPPDSSFHHVGYATDSISGDKDFFALLGYQPEAENFTNPGQGVTGCFLTGPGPRIELLESLPGSDTLTPWLRAGIKMYHFAYMVPDLEKALEWSKNHRGKQVVAPVAAVAFGGRRISFVVFRRGMMIEFIEEKMRSHGRTE